MPTARDPVRRDEAFVVYPHRGFMVAVGTASLLIGAACLIAAIVILPSAPAALRERLASARSSASRPGMSSPQGGVLR